MAHISHILSTKGDYEAISGGAHVVEYQEGETQDAVLEEVLMENQMGKKIEHEMDTVIM